MPFEPARMFKSGLARVFYINIYVVSWSSLVLLDWTIPRNLKSGFQTLTVFVWGDKQFILFHLICSLPTFGFDQFSPVLSTLAKAKRHVPQTRQRISNSKHCTSFSMPSSQNSTGRTSSNPSSFRQLSCSNFAWIIEPPTPPWCRFSCHASAHCLLSLQWRQRRWCRRWIESLRASLLDRSVTQVLLMEVRFKPRTCRKRSSC